MTNVLVRNRIGEVSLITTKGFGDVLRIARQNRKVIYSFSSIMRNEPPVPRERCFEVSGRVGFDGNEIEPLHLDNPDEVRRFIRTSCSTVAICLLHSYANASHEQMAADAIRDVATHVSLSCEVSGESREYERSLVTVLNAGLLSLIAGVEAAGRVATEHGVVRAVSFNMGGTTTDACLLTNGRPEMASQTVVGR